MVIDGSKTGSGFHLLKETAEFLNAERKIHLALLSSFKSSPQNSVIAYTTPGIAGGFLSNESIRLQILSNWADFSKKYCLCDVISESYFLANTAILYSNDLNVFNPCQSLSEVANEHKSKELQSILKSLDLLSGTLEFLFTQYRMNCVVFALFSVENEKSSVIITSRGPSAKFLDHQNEDLAAQWLKFASSVTLPVQIIPVTNLIKTDTLKSYKKHSQPLPMPICDSDFIERSTEIQTDGSSNLKNGRCSEGQREAYIPQNGNNLGITKPRFICNVCGKIFNTQSIMKRHLLQRHLKLQNFPCESCGQEFYRKDFLIGHKWTKHGLSPPKEVKCAMSVSHDGVSEELL